MRKIPLRAAPVDHFGRELGPLIYGEAICNIVMMPAGGLSLAEMPLPLQIGEAVVVALAAGADELVLDEEQWSLLVRRLAAFRFPVANDAYRLFGLAIAGAAFFEAESPACRGVPSTGDLRTSPAAAGPRAVA